MVRIADVPAIERMHDEQEALLGYAPDKPDLFDKPVLLALTLESDGVPQGAFYIEAIGECCFVGIDPKTTADAKDIAPAIFAFAKHRGLRWMRCFIPQGLKDVLGPRLEEAG